MESVGVSDMRELRGMEQRKEEVERRKGGMGWWSNEI